MAKHKPLLIRGDDLYDALGDQMSPPDIAELVRLPTRTDADGFVNCPDVAGWWVVRWPESVLEPQINSDAIYEHAGNTLEEARTKWPGAEEFRSDEST